MKKFFPNFKNFLILFLITLITVVFLELFFLFVQKKNYSLEESVNKLLTKSISNRYLTYEPFVVRGRWVKNFSIDCNKSECLPFKKSKLSDEILFSKKLKEVNDLEKKIVILPLNLEQKFPYFYYNKNFPIYFNYIGFGQIYYSNEETQNILLNRYKNSFLLDACFLNSANRNFNEFQKKIILFKKILLQNKVFKKEDFDCSKKTLPNLIKILKEEKVGYLIERKELDYKNIFKREFCYSNYCLYKIQ